VHLVHACLGVAGLKQFPGAFLPLLVRYVSVPRPTGGQGDQLVLWVYRHNSQRLAFGEAGQVKAHAPDAGIGPHVTIARLMVASRARGVAAVVGHLAAAGFLAAPRGRSAAAGSRIGEPIGGLGHVHDSFR